MINIWRCIILCIIFSILSGGFGYCLGAKKISENITDMLTRIFKNIDNYIIVLALSALVASIIFSIANFNNSVATLVLNIFSSVIFSWLLTKKSSKHDFKEKEEELSLRSYRHINYIETAANTASKKIDKYTDEHTDLTPETKLILSSAQEQIKYIQGGINTCKMDWFDLLSSEEQEKIHCNRNDSDYGTVQKVISNSEINQEDA